MYHRSNLSLITRESETEKQRWCQRGGGGGEGGKSFFSYSKLQVIKEEQTLNEVVMYVM